MADIYYYSNGKKIILRRLHSTRVIQVSDDRQVVNAPGWLTVPINHPTIKILFREDLVPPQIVSPNTLMGMSKFALAAEENYEDRNALDTTGKFAITNAPGSPVLVDSNGTLLLPSREIIAKLKLGLNIDTLNHEMQNFGVTEIKPIEGIKNVYKITVTDNDFAIKLSQKLVETGAAEYAHPNFLEEIPNRSHTSPLNSFFTKQWHLKNSGQNGAKPHADINAEEAWEITRGDPSITVCILDRGIDSNHEAFSVIDKLVPGYDFENDDTEADPEDSSHGTSCAGLVGAPWEGGKIVGVAPDCSLMPIRRPALSEHLTIAQAFAWAANNGADVINCSFGVDRKPWILPDVVRDVLNTITTLGRNGKGCVVVWAAGNGNEDVGSDEWATHPNVITVAASTDFDRRATYSDYGKEIDVCAPSSGGINGITTTKNGGYWSRFGGTSAAAPIVAGIAALLLSLDNELTAKEIKEKLISSADKIDRQSSSYSSNGHSNLYGYGRVNARKALETVSVLEIALRDLEIQFARNDIVNFAQRRLFTNPIMSPIKTLLTRLRFEILLLLKHDDGFKRDAKQLLLLALRLTTIKEGQEEEHIDDRELVTLSRVIEKIVALNA